MNIADLRSEYSLRSLDESDVDPSPLRQFERWFDEAMRAEVPESNAMTLATVDASGQPSARIVLIKGFDEAGITFFTNYTSRKGRELAAHPRAALLFFWPQLQRQVRIEGTVSRVPSAESDTYFDSRPIGSRHGAWASPQSQEIHSREELAERLRSAVELHGEHPPRPPHWGGYRLSPNMFEFWQGRESRLHDRICYALNEGCWRRTRLAP